MLKKCASIKEVVSKYLVFLSFPFKIAVAILLATVQDDVFLYVAGGIFAALFVFIVSFKILDMKKCLYFLSNFEALIFIQCVIYFTASFLCFFQFGNPVAALYGSFVSMEAGYALSVFMTSS